MDLQTRKLEFVKEFLKLQSENAVADLEKALKKARQKKDAEVKPFTIEQLQSRVEESLQDYKNGKVTAAEELIAEIEKWS
jgi:hypothetical protein